MQKHFIGSILFLAVVGLAGFLPATPTRVMVIPKGVTHVFWKTVRLGAEKAGRELNLEVIWNGPSQDDQHDAQIGIIKRAIRMDVKAIVLAPNHKYLLTGAVRLARENGIVVVVIDSAMDGSDYVSFIATDNEQAGYLAGNHLVSLLPAGGRVAMLRYFKGNTSTDKREAGFIRAMDGVARIELVAAPYVGASIGAAYHNALILLEKMPNLNGFFAPNESSTEGLLKALAVKSMRPTAKVVGFDSNPALIQALREDRLNATVVQDPLQMGYLGVKTAFTALMGEPVRPVIHTPVRLITRSNLDTPETQQLLNPEF